jgi:probable F420-dependent oxidoreductase
MKIGFSLPQIGKQAGPDGLVKVAETAEKLGYDSVWVLDRLMWPIKPRDPYPVTPDGHLPEEYQSVLDPIETLTFAAAVTQKVKLGLSVLVAAYQGPVLTARRIATLDVLSKGRVLCGIGGGWSHDEYEACNVPFQRRDDRVAELLRAMVAVWTQDTVEFKGKFYTIAPSKIGPKPVQKPHPPVFQAAYAPKSMRRTAELTNGWNPGGPPSWDWLIDQTKALKALTKEAGRDPNKMEVVLRAFVSLGNQPRPADGWLFTGTLDQIKADAKRAAELGVSHILLETQFNPGMDVPTMLKQAELLRGVA